MFEKILAVDLDGTIYSRVNGFNQADIEVLKQLPEKGFVRVIATGRTLKSAQRVLSSEFPIDYLVFSSGAGVFDWKQQKLVRSTHLNHSQANDIIGFLRTNGIEFTVHESIPDNHLYYYSSFTKKHPDFIRYLNLNVQYGNQLNGELPQKDYTQVLAFIDDVSFLEKVRADFRSVKVIRATSPIDDKSIWMECFHHEVSKAYGVQLLADNYGISPENISVVGNDYNDEDMLSKYSKSYVVENAPADLLRKYEVVNHVLNAPLQDWYQRFASLV